jgi:formylglycine-generating enzyme required for sulfatase activity
MLTHRLRQTAKNGIFFVYERSRNVKCKQRKLLRVGMKLYNFTRRPCYATVFTWLYYKNFCSRRSLGGSTMKHISVTVFVFVGMSLNCTLAAAQDKTTPLSTFKDCDTCPELVVIPPGEFLMGAPADEPKRSTTGSEDPYHNVAITKSFAIGKYETTWDEWEGCVAAGGCGGYMPPDRGWGRGRRPVIVVSWEDAKMYAAFLSKRTGHVYRLPTEAEWEYSARAGTTTPFSTGQTITTDQANFNGTFTYNGSGKGEFRKRTMPVGSFPPNAFGLHDVHGNVMEYTEDCGNLSYEGAPTDGSAWATGDCRFVTMRGGTWKSMPLLIRSAIRKRMYRNGKRDTFGFRLVRELKP